MHELSLASAIVETVERHAGGAAGARGDVRVGRLRQVVPESLEFYFGIVGARHGLCEGARLELRARAGAAALHGLRARVGAATPPFRCPACGRRRVEVDARRGVRGRVDRDEEEACIAHT